MLKQSTEINSWSEALLRQLTDNRTGIHRETRYLKVKTEKSISRESQGASYHQEQRRNKSESAIMSIILRRRICWTEKLVHQQISRITCKKKNPPITSTFSSHRCDESANANGTTPKYKFESAAKEG